MTKEIELLDLDFDGGIVGLYTIIDKTTGQEVAPVMPILNDIVAIQSFKQLIDEQKDKKAAYSKYQLKTVGIYDTIKHEILSGESYILCDESDDVEKYLKDIIAFMNAKEEEE